MKSTLQGLSVKAVLSSSLITQGTLRLSTWHHRNHPQTHKNHQQRLPALIYWFLKFVKLSADPFENTVCHSFSKACNVMVCLNPHIFRTSHKIYRQILFHRILSGISICEGLALFHMVASA